MAARAVWKGRILFEDVDVPVKLYSAVQDRSVHFRLLHEPDLVPVKQRMLHPGTDEEVPREEIRRGYVDDDGAIVVLDAEELAELEPEPSREIRITRFVDPARIDHRWYDRPYWLGPDEDHAAYFTLAQALEKEGKEGVARWVMRKKEYRGALRAERGRLALVTLRPAGRVVAAGALPRPSGRALDPREKAMAEQLLAALSGDFEPEAWEDEYRKRVLELVEAKARGEAVELRAYVRKKERGSLADALEASVAAAREKKTA